MERSKLLLYLGLWDYIQKSVLKKERDAADAYAGPDKSYPLYADGKHLAAAWDLAGRADDPAEVRRKILAFAKAHNLMHLLPLSAQHAAGVMEVTRKAFADGEWPDIDEKTLTALLGRPAAAAAQPIVESVQKAEANMSNVTDVDADGDTADDTDVAADDARDDAALKQLLEMALNHEVGEGDIPQFERLREFARANGLGALLPDTPPPAASPAAPVQKAEPTSEPVAKAAAPEPQAPKAPEVGQIVTLDDGDGIPVAKSMLVTKSWSDPRSGDVYIEGWVSTEARDQQKDIVPPEAFSSALPEYMARYAPLTTEHRLYPNIRKGQLEQYPVGHMQRIALVRDGQVLQEAVHPTDPAEFEHFPGFGTGAYGRGVINDSQAANQVVKGNMAGFSWIGRLKEYEVLPDGGKRYTRIDPMMETTLSAFPVNPTARLVAQGRAKSTQE